MLQMIDIRCDENDEDNRVSVRQTMWPKSKDIKRVHSSQNKSHARSAILRMRNFPASTVKFFYKEIDGEIRIFVIKRAILTKLSR